ncbi:hypothetical protein A7U60_g1113 [Sanghuangporus baumii]|uniref:DUF6534 domain-containing protein n=1 Tax=Sanghuangporus baumii TaxID=108892 RepID=A0A9Q5I4P7_SANBA|nr:hypothetical protein A7U60_g1113 [Sanghuangporus baumii]
MEFSTPIFIQKRIYTGLKGISARNSQTPSSSESSPPSVTLPAALRPFRSMASETASIVPPSQIDSTFGCLFLAAIFSSMYEEFRSCLQSYLYYEEYWKEDRRWLRAYVSSAWILDTAHQVIVVEYTYDLFVKGIVYPTYYTHVPISIPNAGILGAIVDCMVQILFVRRAWYLSKKNIVLTGLLVAAVLAQFAMNMLYSCMIYNERNLLLMVKYINVEIAFNCVIAFTDTLLSIVLIWLLRKSRSGFQRTDSIINRLVMYTVGSGFITSLWMVLALVAVGVARDSLIYALADLVLPKLYFNCLLASLNARSSLRGAFNNQGEGIHFRDLSASSAGRVNFSADLSHRTAPPRVIECRVDIDVDESGVGQQKVRGAYVYKDVKANFQKVGMNYTPSESDTVAIKS